MQASKTITAEDSLSYILQTELGLLKGGLKNDFYVFSAYVLTEMARISAPNDLFDRSIK